MLILAGGQQPVPARELIGECHEESGKPRGAAAGGGAGNFYGGSRLGRDGEKGIGNSFEISMYG